MEVEPACFRVGNEGGMVRPGMQRLIGSMGHAWADTNGLGGERNVLGVIH